MVINYSVRSLVALNSTVMFGALALHAIGQEVSPTPERAGREKVDWAQHERAGRDAVRGAPGDQYRSSRTSSDYGISSGTGGMSPTVRPSVSPKSVSADDGTSKSASPEQKKSPQASQSPSIREGEGKKKSVLSDQKK